MSTTTEAGTATDAVAVPAWDVADRLRKGLRVSGVSVQGMADYLGVERNTVGRYINGHSTPDVRTLRLWAMRTGVPFEWLRDGESPQPVEARGSRVAPAVGLEPTTVRSTVIAGQDECVRGRVTPLRRPSGTGRSRREALVRRREFGAGEAA